MKARPGTWIVLSLVGLGTAALILMPGQVRSSPPFLNERSGFRSLKEYAAAQAAFRNKGFGGNGQGVYWRDDMAGLYALKGSESEPIRLIELSLACADTRPVTKVEDVGDFKMVKSAKAGYWFKALRFRDEAVPKPDRFAACAYPDSLSAGKYLYIISGKNLIHRRPYLPTQVPDFYPDDPEKEGWESRGGTANY